MLLENNVTWLCKLLPVWIFVSNMSSMLLKFLGSWWLLKSCYCWQINFLFQVPFPYKARASWPYLFQPLTLPQMHYSDLLYMGSVQVELHLLSACGHSNSPSILGLPWENARHPGIRKLAVQTWWGKTLTSRDRSYWKNSFPFSFLPWIVLQSFTKLSSYLPLLKSSTSVKKNARESGKTMVFKVWFLAPWEYLRLS